MTRTISMGNHVALEVMLAQLQAAANSWTTTNETQMIRLQWLASFHHHRHRNHQHRHQIHNHRHHNHHHSAMETEEPFHISPPLAQAMIFLMEQMARKRQQLQLYLAVACHDTLIFQHVLKRARELQVLHHLIIADRSPTSAIWKENTVLFEILANPHLEILELNCPPTSPTPPAVADVNDDANHSRDRPYEDDSMTLLFRRFGQAIAANPFLKRLTLYTYDDVTGIGAAALLQVLAKKSSQLSSSFRTEDDTRGRGEQRERRTINTTGLKSLHLYCPRSATHQIVQGGLAPLLRQEGCPLRILELTCIQHHHFHHPHHDQHTMNLLVENENVPILETNTSDRDSMIFPLSTLVQEGLIHNSSLKRLGIFHADLTTDQVDQDLLCHLYRHPQLAVLDLFGNRIESLFFPKFYQQQLSASSYYRRDSSTTLEQVLLQHNPCLTRHPSELQRYTLPPIQTIDYPEDYSAGADNAPATIALSLLDMLLTLFQHHPRLYYFGVDPHQCFSSTQSSSSLLRGGRRRLLAILENIFSSSPNNNKMNGSSSKPNDDHHQKQKRLLLFLADANRIGLRVKQSSGAAVRIPILPSSTSSRTWRCHLPSSHQASFLISQILDDITQHPELILYQSPTSPASDQKTTEPVVSRSANVAHSRFHPSSMINARQPILTMTPPDRKVEVGSPTSTMSSWYRMTTMTTPPRSDDHSQVHPPVTFKAPTGLPVDWMVSTSSQSGNDNIGSHFRGQKMLPPAVFVTALSGATRKTSSSSLSTTSSSSLLLFGNPESRSRQDPLLPSYHSFVGNHSRNRPHSQHRLESTPSLSSSSQSSGGTGPSCEIRPVPNISNMASSRGGDDRGRVQSSNRITTTTTMSIASPTTAKSSTSCKKLLTCQERQQRQQRQAALIWAVLRHNPSLWMNSKW